MNSRGGLPTWSGRLAGCVLLVMLVAPLDAKKEAGAVQEKLDRRIDLAFEDQPLRDVLLYMASHLELQMHTQWKRLEESGIAADSTVTIALKEVRAGTALELLLDEVSDGSASYYVRDGVIIVTTIDQAANAWQPRVFFVKDLVDVAPPDNAMGMMGMPGMGMSGSSGMMPGAGSMGPGTPGPEPKLPREGFLDLITAAVAPNSWAETGGNGNIEYYQGFLVVKNSARVQDEVAELLEAMREARGPRPPQPGVGAAMPGGSAGGTDPFAAPPKLRAPGSESDGSNGAD